MLRLVGYALECLVSFYLEALGFLFAIQGYTA